MSIKQVFNFILGLLSGALVGAAAALLFAPLSGSDTRQTITDRIQQIIEAGKQARLERRVALEAEFNTAIRIPLPIEEQD